MAGRAAPCPEPSGLKAPSPVSRLVSTSRLPADPATAVERQPESTIMTIERPMFPPVDQARRHFLSVVGGGAVVTFAPSAAEPAPAAAAQTLDAELIELGARFEPLVDRYYAARAIWARRDDTSSRPSTIGSSVSRRTGTYQDTPEIRAAWEEACERNGLQRRVRARFGDLQGNGADRERHQRSVRHLDRGTSRKGAGRVLGGRAVVRGDTEFSFEDAYPFQQLFTAVAELCGLKDKMAATGYALPDIGMVDAAPCDSDDDGEEA